MTLSPAFTNALPATTTQTLTTPDGKWTYTFSATTTTTVSVSVASAPTTILSDSGMSIYDSQNTWSVVKGVIQFNGAPMAGTNNVAKLVWTNGLIWQQNTAGLWWHWDDINQIWVTGPAPI